MSRATSEIVAVLTFLLPGFVGAAAFHSLTSHPKPGEFDRVGAGAGRGVDGIRMAGGVGADGGGGERGCGGAAGGVLRQPRRLVHGALRRIGVTGETSYPSE